MVMGIAAQQHLEGIRMGKATERNEQRVRGMTILGLFVLMSSMMPHKAWVHHWQAVLAVQMGRQTHTFCHFSAVADIKTLQGLMALKQGLDFGEFSSLLNFFL